MKKIVVAICALCLLGSTFAVAAPGFSGKKISSKLIQANQNMNVTFAGVNIFIPKGQTVILGQRSDGSIVIRGNDLQQVRLDDTFISAPGFTVLSYRPESNVVFINRGESLTVTDPAGHTATVQEGGAVSTVNAAVNSDTVPEMKAAAQADAEQTAAELGLEPEVPTFVAATETSAAAQEQAAQNAEDEQVLSPSAPR